MVDAGGEIEPAFIADDQEPAARPFISAMNSPSTDFVLSVVNTVTSMLSSTLDFGPWR